jgi:hypothetical protein
VVFTCVVIVLAVSLGLDNVATARLALFLIALVLLYSLFHAYGRLLRSRPKPKVALSTALRRGLGSLTATFREICRDFPYVLK